ncbi:MAG: hypothetical protein PHE70_11225 [Tepidanaerobacteraceae bacterium]|nr:hypothetical protein [Tepidanaerobacteraceae bacterium]
MEGVFLGTLFTAIIVILGICLYRKVIILQSYACNLDHELVIVLLVKDAQNEIEGIIRDYYRGKTQSKEFWIVDCGSHDQTPQILERISWYFSGLRLLFVSDIPLKLCKKEVIEHINAPAVMIIDGTQLSYKNIMSLTHFLCNKNNVAIGLKTYEK